MFCGAGVWRLESARSGLSITPLEVGLTPATVYRRSKRRASAPAVVIAHGFAGSRQLMEAYALTLAHAGYVAVSFDFEGHGRNPTPMSGDLDAHRGDHPVARARDRPRDGRGLGAALMSTAVWRSWAIRWPPTSSSGARSKIPASPPRSPSRCSRKRADRDGAAQSPDDHRRLGTRSCARTRSRTRASPTRPRTRAKRSETPPTTPAGARSRRRMSSMSAFSIRRRRCARRGRGSTPCSAARAAARSPPPADGLCCCWPASWFWPGRSPACCRRASGLLRRCR